MTQKEALLIMVAVAIVFIALMAWGWRGRQKRSAAQVGALPTIPSSGLGEQLHQTVGGVYVSSTTHGDWLDRIAAQDLGYRSNANVTVHSAGVVIERAGATNIFIPSGNVIKASATNGIAGKFMGRNSLALVEWRAPSPTGTDALIDSGFKPDHDNQLSGLIEAINSLVPTGHDPQKENQ